MQYDRANLQRAFDATRGGMSVYRAARMYLVPESTLRDRTRGLVEIEPNIGFETIFSRPEEKKLVDHVTYMADIGYGYNKIGVQSVARAYAESLGKNIKSESALSNCWFYGFLKRWPDLKVVKPQKLSIARAQSASEERINSYYKELATILTKNNLKDKPERIYNVDETGISTEHSPPRIVCDKFTKPQAVSSSRSKLVTIIAGGNALGNSLPPYYIFPGKRWNPEFLNGSLPGSSGEMSESGWSNTKILNNYVTNHFMKYANLSVGEDTTPTYLLYDGHRSHINLTLTDWAKQHNVILFVLPPHTSHLTQPLDVAVFGPLKAMYNKECQLYMQRNPGVNISKHQIAELTNKPYMRALSSENLISAFRKTGIYPFERQVITASQLAPSVIYEVSESEVEKTDENETLVENIKNIENIPEDPEPVEDQTIMTITSLDLSTNQTVPTSNPDTEVPVVVTSSFFEDRTIKTVVKKPPFLAGNLLKKHNQVILQASKPAPLIETSSIQKTTSKKQKISKKSEKIEKLKESSNKKTQLTEKPSTSGLSKGGGPIYLSSEELSECQ